MSSILKIDQNGLIIDYNNKHSYVVDEKKIKTILIKDEAKKTIDNIDIIYNIKSIDIYDTSIKNIYKLKSDNISDEESDNNKENK